MRDELLNIIADTHNGQMHRDPHAFKGNNSVFYFRDAIREALEREAVSLPNDLAALQAQLEETQRALERARARIALDDGQIENEKRWRKNAEKSATDADFIASEFYNLCAILLEGVDEAWAASGEGRATTVKARALLNEQAPATAAISRLRKAWDKLGECQDEFGPKDWPDACAEIQDELDSAIVALLESTQ